MSFANLKKLQIFYETRGAGEPIVLIPGFASGAWIWFRQVEDLSENFKVVIFDPRGVGNSILPDGKNPNSTIASFAADTIILLDHLKIEKAHVLGASFGGFVAQEFALNYPERLNKLILVCTSFGGANHVAPELEVLTAFASTDGMNTSERIRNFMTPAFTSDFRGEQAEIVEEVCRLREQNVVPENIYLAQLQSATKFDAEQRVGEIKAETLVITGDSDSVVPPQNSHNLAKAIPNAALEIIKNGSHLFFIEKADEFNRKVKDFLL